MKTLLSLVAVLLALSSLEAEAQMVTNARPVELTSRGVAQISPYSDDGWRHVDPIVSPGVAPVQPQFVAYRAPMATATVPVMPVAYQPMPIQRPAVWTGYPQTVRYGNCSAGACQTIPVTQLAPQTVPITTAIVPGQNGYYFGKGILGQPKLYVQGQPIRNSLRYLTF